MMQTILDWFMEPFMYPFMQRAMFAAIIVAVVCAILSCFLVLKGWALMGDAISHAVLPGIVIAFVLGIPLAIGAFFAGIFCAISTGYLYNNTRLKEDTVMGIVFSGMFAFGIVLFAKIKTSEHLLHILFGHLLGITDYELKQTVIISLVTFIIIIWKRKDFLLYCFDPSHARVVGLPINILHYGLLALLSLTIISAMQIVGVILVVALLISPGITAYLLSSRFDHMIIIAVIASVLSTVIGTLASYHLDASTGPCIVLVQAMFFGFALIFSSLKNKQQPIIKA